MKNFPSYRLRLNSKQKEFIPRKLYGQMTDLGLAWLVLILNLLEIDVFSLSGFKDFAFV